VKFIDFLQNIVPIQYRSDKQLVSHNIHTSTYNYKYTFSVEIAPICRVRVRVCGMSLLYVGPGMCVVCWGVCVVGAPWVKGQRHGEGKRGGERRTALPLVPPIAGSNSEYEVSC
jgi:hypothetical protein